MIRFSNHDCDPSTTRVAVISSPVARICKLDSSGTAKGIVIDGMKSLMASCDTVTRCLSGSTAITLPLKSKRFSFVDLRQHELAPPMSSSENTIAGRALFICQYLRIVVRVGSRRVVDNSRG